MIYCSLHCSFCGFKKKAENTNDLVEVKLGNIPTNLAGTSNVNRGKFFKCTNCGRLLKAFIEPGSKKETEWQPEEPPDEKEFMKRIEETMRKKPK